MANTDSTLLIYSTEHMRVKVYNGPGAQPGGHGPSSTTLTPVGSQEPRTPITGTFMDVLSQDLRVALRRIQRAPALATAIVLTIGLGLGAAAAIFTTSDAALVEPLPYAEPQRLVHLWEVRAGTAVRSPPSYPTLLDWRSRAKSFSALEAYDPTNSTVGMGDEA